MAQQTGPVQLARFVFDGAEYFADLRLAEFRGVKDFSQRIVFDSPEGRQACDFAGIVSCPECAVSMIVSSVVRAEGVRCPQCGCAVD